MPVKQISGINLVQQAHLDLIKKNETINGEQIVKDLLHYRETWTSVFLLNPGRLDEADLALLPAIDEDVWPCDTLYIYASGLNTDRLDTLVKSWLPEPTSITWLGTPPVPAGMGLVLKVWWNIGSSGG